MPTTKNTRGRRKASVHIPARRPVSAPSQRSMLQYTTEELFAHGEPYDTKTAEPYQTAAESNEQKEPHGLKSGDGAKKKNPQQYEMKKKMLEAFELEVDPKDKPGQLAKGMVRLSLLMYAIWDGDEEIVKEYSDGA